jgi:hypothetical protein
MVGLLLVLLVLLCCSVLLMVLTLLCVCWGALGVLLWSAGTRLGGRL